MTPAQAWLKRLISCTLAAGLLALVWPQSLGGTVAYVRVSGDSMVPTYHDGDVIVVRDQRTYRPGEVVAYKVPPGDVGAGQLVIHRLVSGDGERGFVAQGDGNRYVDAWRPTKHTIVGREWFSLGPVGKAITVLLRPLPLAVLAGALAAWVALGFRTAAGPPGEPEKP